MTVNVAMRWIVAVVALALCPGCTADKEAGPGSHVVQRARLAPEAEVAESPPPAPVRRLIRTVDLDLTVDDPTASAERIRELVAEAAGYVAEASAYRVGELLHYAMTLRVPVGRLDALVEELKAMAVEIDREHLRSEDVTDQFVDLEARLRTLRMTEVELQALLAESRSRGSKAEDIMAVYRHLTEIRTDIERLQGRLNGLDNRTTLATVNLNLSPTESAQPLAGAAWRPLDTLRSSLRTLLSALRGLADLAIVTLVVVAPIALLAGAAVWLVVRAVGMIRRRGRAG